VMEFIARQPQDRASQATLQEEAVKSVCHRKEGIPPSCHAPVCSQAIHRLERPEPGDESPDYELGQRGQDDKVFLTAP
jgi:hypothetical protein